MYKCSICNTESNFAEFTSREMMYGIRDEFKYIQCLECGSIQICEIPEMDKYYPSGYYSFKTRNDSFIKRFLKKKRSDFALYGSSFIGKVLVRLIGVPEYAIWFKELSITNSSEILDIGCGTGNLINDLYSVGFNNLTGIDLFVPENLKSRKGLTIVKGDIMNLEGNYDLIMMNHSLEHMINHQQIFEKVYSLLKDDGTFLIRTPIVNWAWEKYKENWASLDAPRHLIIHSERSLNLLAEQKRFNVVRTFYDSTIFQFLASEQYMKDIPHLSEVSYKVNRSKSIFSTKDIQRFKDKTNELNLKRLGDQGCFYLKKI